MSRFLVRVCSVSAMMGDQDVPSLTGETESCCEREALRELPAPRVISVNTGSFTVQLQVQGAAALLWLLLANSQPCSTELAARAAHCGHACDCVTRW